MIIEFYVNNLKFIQDIENADINFIPALARRRMSSLDKISAASLNFCISEDTENIVFASKTGEIERLLKIIEQYKNENETSPALFSGSVHNYPVSSFLLNYKKSVPYTAMAAGEKTFQNGLLASVISKYSNNLFVYSDIEEGKYISCCVNISKTPKENSDKYILKQEFNPEINCSVQDFLSFFEKKTNKLQASLYTIERAAND